MASDLIEMAREVGGDALAERVERLEDEVDEVQQMIQTEMKEDVELHQRLKEDSDLSDNAIEGMDLQAKREVAEATGLRDETVNVEIPVAGRAPGEKTNADETVQKPRPEPRTYTEEVPIEGGDDPETITVEREDYRTPVEDVLSWKRQFRQQIIEENRRREEERSNGREEENNEVVLPGVSYLNADEVDTDDDSDIPAPGEVSRERQDDDGPQ